MIGDDAGDFSSVDNLVGAEHCSTSAAAADSALPAGFDEVLRDRAACVDARRADADRVTSEDVVGDNRRRRVPAVDEDAGALLRVRDGVLLDHGVAVAPDVDAGERVAHENVAADRRCREVEDGAADAAALDDVLGEGAEAVVVDEDAEVGAVVEGVLAAEIAVAVRTDVGADRARLDVVRHEPPDAALAHADRGAGRALAHLVPQKERVRAVLDVRRGEAERAERVGDKEAARAVRGEDARLLLRHEAAASDHGAGALLDEHADAALVDRHAVAQRRRAGRAVDADTAVVGELQIAQQHLRRGADDGDAAGRVAGDGAVGDDGH